METEKYYGGGSFGKERNLRFMPAFGENLRREREMRGVSLEEIASATKISIRFLGAIEREEFSKLPGGIFSRSFVRSYARYLGLDEDRVVTEYQAAARPQTDFDLHRLVAGNANVKPTSRTPLIATAIAVVLLIGGYLLFRYAPRAAEAPAPPPPVPAESRPAAPSQPVPVPMASGEATGVPGANPATSMPPAGGASSAPSAAGANPQTPLSATASSAAASNLPKPMAGAAGDSELMLQVAATERTWMAVDADGKTVLQRVLNPQEVETLKAHNAFDVTTGNAHGVVLTLNGETLKPLGREGEVKTVHLTRQDLKGPATP